MKKLIALVLCICMMLSLAACNNGKSDTAGSTTGNEETSSQTASAAGNENQGQGPLVIYSTVPDYEYNAIIVPFEEKYPGISVEVVQGGAGELKTRIQAESENPQCDLMFGGIQYHDAIGEYADMWEDYVAVHDDEMTGVYKNNTGKMTYFGTQLVIFIVNKELADELGVEIKGYADLLDPALKGKVIGADPSASSSAWRNLVNLLVAMGSGDNDYEDGWEYLSQLMENMDGVVASSSSNVYKSVFEGEYVVGLTYEGPSNVYLEEGFEDVIEVVYPAEGTTTSPFGACIVKNARNIDNAKLFMDYLNSDEAQANLAATTTRHVKDSVPTSNQFIPAVSDVKLLEEDVDYFVENKNDILERYTKMWTNTQ